MEVALEVRKAAAEARQELHGIAVEATAARHPEIGAATVALPDPSSDASRTH
jgi:hypothetical protein